MSTWRWRFTAFPTKTSTTSPVTKRLKKWISSKICALRSILATTIFYQRRITVRTTKITGTRERLELHHTITNPTICKPDLCMDLRATPTRSSIPLRIASKVTVMQAEHGGHKVHVKDCPRLISLSIHNQQEMRVNRASPLWPLMTNSGRKFRTVN